MAKKVKVLSLLPLSALLTGCTLPAFDFSSWKDGSHFFVSPDQLVSWMGVLISAAVIVLLAVYLFSSRPETGGVIRNLVWMAMFFNVFLLLNLLHNALWPPPLSLTYVAESRGWLPLPTDINPTADGIAILIVLIWPLVSILIEGVIFYKLLVGTFRNTVRQDLSGLQSGFELAVGWALTPWLIFIAVEITRIVGDSIFGKIINELVSIDWLFSALFLLACYAGYREIPGEIRLRFGKHIPILYPDLHQENSGTRATATSTTSSADSQQQNSTTVVAAGIPGGDGHEGESGETGEHGAHPESPTGGPSGRPPTHGGPGPTPGGETGDSTTVDVDTDNQTDVKPGAAPEGEVPPVGTDDEFQQNIENVDAGDETAVQQGDQTIEEVGTDQQFAEETGETEEGGVEGDQPQDADLTVQTEDPGMVPAIGSDGEFQASLEESNPDESVAQSQPEASVDDVGSDQEFHEALQPADAYEPHEPDERSDNETVDDRVPVVETQLPEYPQDEPIREIREVQSGNQPDRDQSESSGNGRVPDVEKQAPEVSETEIVNTTTGSEIPERSRRNGHDGRNPDWVPPRGSDDEFDKFLKEEVGNNDGSH